MTSRARSLIASRDHGLGPAATACLITGLSVPFLELIWSAFGSRGFAADELIPGWVVPLSLALVAAFCCVAYAVVWRLFVCPLTTRLRRPIAPSAVALGLFLAAGVWLRLATGGWASRTTRLAVILAASAGVFFLGVVVVDALAPRARQFAHSLAYALPLVLIQICAFLFATANLGPEQNAPLFWAGVLVFGPAGIVTARLCFRQDSRWVAQRALQVVAVILLIAPVATASIQSLGNRSDANTDQPAGPNVILLVVDTLRRDALSAYGGRNQTPHIDQLAKDGALFENAYANAPWTLPSMATMLSGFSPWIHQATDTRSTLPKQLPTLAERLGDSGYVTQSVGYNPFLVDPPGSGQGLQRGFDDSRFYPGAGPPETLGIAILRRFLRELSQDYPRTHEITEQVMEWLDGHRQEKFFLWIHYFDPHMPYEPPGRWLPTGVTPEPSIGPTFGYDDLYGRGKPIDSYTSEEVDWIRELYDAEVRYVDAQIGKLIERLRRDGIYDDTMIVLAGDHGEEFLEHLSFDHGHTVYNELLSVPLIIKPAGNLRATRIASNVNTGSVTPTIIDSVGWGDLEGSLSYGSLVGFWKGGARSVEPVFSMGPETAEGMEAVIFGNMKYIRRLSTLREELYDLATDPREQHNLALLMPDLVLEGRRLLQQYNGSERSAAALRGVDKPTGRELDQSTIDRLRSLGYLR